MTKTREFTYDRKLNRYRYKDSGKLAPRAAILNLTKKNIANTEKELGVITNLLYDGKMTLGDWQRTFSRSLKTLYLENLLLGKGGLNNTSDSDYLAVGRSLRKEYGYLRKFAQQIKAGEVSRPQALNRAGLYSNKSRSAYWLGQDRDDDSAWMRRLLGATDDHCADCLGYAARGWQPKGTLPLPTEACQCRANCRCRVIYRNNLPQEDSVLNALARFSKSVGFIK